MHAFTKNGTLGPGEPPGFARLRETYWTKRALLDALENRICRTDAGMTWLMRVKQIGKPRTATRRTYGSAPRTNERRVSA